MRTLAGVALLIAVGLSPTIDADAIANGLWVGSPAASECSTTIAFVGARDTAVFSQDSAPPKTPGPCVWWKSEFRMTFTSCSSPTGFALRCEGFDPVSTSDAVLQIQADGAWSITELVCSPYCQPPPRVVASGVALRVL